MLHRWRFGIEIHPRAGGIQAGHFYPCAQRLIIACCRVTTADLGIHCRERLSDITAQYQFAPRCLPSVVTNIFPLQMYIVAELGFATEIRATSCHNPSRPRYRYCDQLA